MPSGRTLPRCVMVHIPLILALLLLGRTLPSVEPASGAAPARHPAWAVEVGDDQFGRWADVAVGGVRQRMRCISAGIFTMGSQPGDPEAEKSETPHQVTLSRGFWLADSECTQGLWRVVMGSNPAQVTGDAQRPVERVSFSDVQDFCRQLNETTHQHCFTIPSEAQWEFACRAGSSAPAPASALDGGAWYGGNSGGVTHAVKTKAPNAWGLYDMLGNVSEWCSDWLWDYPTDAVTDPAAPTAALVRVVRGGSWDSEAKCCRAAFRSGVDPGLHVGLVGFRMCAMALEP